MKEKVIIIGGGVSGITTALVLQLLGYDTEIYTDKWTPDTQDKALHPEFASLYPSASIIPHSVYSDHLEKFFLRSQSFFYELRKLTFPGLVIHKHYEVFEFESEPPRYLDWMLNSQPIQELDPHSIPRRSSDHELHGWAFDCLFADWPLYLPALAQFYKEVGGSITKKELAPKDINTLPAEVIVNCSGMGSQKLFEDPSDRQLVMRGHLLHKADAPLLTNADNEIISYNYSPGASVYADADGEACDVYCYPRKDGWILGGSRQRMALEDMGHEEKPNQPEYEIENIRFPKPMIDLNKEILETTFGATLKKSAPLSPTFGYRYIRNYDNGLRLDHQEIFDKKIYHNYGHGGAGVTLSWGCALEIAEQITTQSVEEITSALLETMNA